MTAALLPAPWRSRVRSGVTGVASTLLAPLLPADVLDLVAPLRAGAELRGRIVSVVPETADAVTVTLRPGRGWRGHVPGQYVRIGIEIDGVRHWRAYSLTHGPRTDGTISFTTKAIPDGVVSNHLVRRAAPGTLVHLDQATGDFTLPATAPTKVLFLTAGSGITPVMGMLRNRFADLADVVHVHLAPNRDAVIFGEELRAYAGPTYRLHEHLDDEAGAFFDVADLDLHVPDWRERATWVCGPTALLDAAESHWAVAGLADALHVERFRPTVVAAGEGGTITFLNSVRDVEADGATPILDAGEDAGVLMRSGCRMGICFGCVVTLREGAVRDLRTGELTIAEDGDPVTVQTCVSAVAGSCQLDA